MTLVLLLRHPHLAAEPALLVPAERRVRRVGMVAVHPDAPRLDRAGHLVRLVRVARPYSRAQPVHGGIGKRDGLLFGLEGGAGGDWAKDLRQARGDS